LNFWHQTVVGKLNLTVCAMQGKDSPWGKEGEPSVPESSPKSWANNLFPPFFTA
jgi:hypothetical protein